jgi:O-antigen/teichoic acid export membrane protein
MSILLSIRKTLESSVAQVFNIATSVVRTKLISIRLGAEAFAVLGQLTHLSMIFSFLYSLGMNNRVVAVIAERRGKGDAEGVDKIQRTFLLTAFWVSVILSVGCWILYELIGEWLFPTWTEVHYFVRVVAISIVFESLAIVYVSFINGRKLTRLMVQLSIVGSIISSGSVVALMWIYGLDGAVWSIAVTSVLNLAVTLAACRYAGIPIYIGGLFQFSAWDKKLFSTLIVIGLVSIYTGVLFQFVALYQKIWITDHEGLKMTGYYHAVMTVATRYLGIFMLAVNFYFMPHLAEQKDDAALARELNTGTRAMLLLLFPILAGLLLFAPEVLWFLYAKDFQVLSAQLQLMALAFLLRMGTALLGIIWVIRNKSRFWLFNDTFSAICILGGSIGMYPWFGINSMFYALTITYVLVLVLQLWYARYSLGLRLTPQVMRLLILTSGCLAILYVVGRFGHSLPFYRAIHISLGAVLVALTLYLNISRTEMERTWAALKVKLGRT